MSKIVCLDNHILIWGVEQKARDNQKEMIPRAKYLIDSLSKNDIQAIVPTVVLSEFLMPIPTQEVAKYINVIQRHLMIVPYDAIAALQFAKVWQAKYPKLAEELRDSEGIRKNHLKIDCMIVATAITRKADCIYSYDRGLQKFAEGYIEVREIPDSSSQQSLI
jgi:predicted nucleic acid-binding protein